MKNLQELFEHQILDLYSAEEQLIEALPLMQEKARNTELKDAFAKHLQETQEQKERLDKICDTLDIKGKSETCKAMQGLIREAKTFIGEAENDEVMDAGLIAESQRIEHYEIAGYGTAVRFAKELEEFEIADILQETLQEEYHANDKLNSLAMGRLNEKAKA